LTKRAELLIIQGVQQAGTIKLSPGGKTLVLVRGLPGSGKSTLARFIAPDACFAGDDFFEKDGGYDFDRDLAPLAHADCARRAAEAMAAGVPVVAVHNTFVESWEAEPYYRQAALFGYDVQVVEAQGDFGSVHDVPPETVADMARRWHRTLKPPREYATARKLAAHRAEPASDLRAEGAGDGHGE